jgi:hypothetical protein
MNAWVPIVAIAALAIAEAILSWKWNAFDFTFGLPIFWRLANVLAERRRLAG